MTDKLKKHYFNHIAKRAFMVNKALAALLSASVLALPAHSAETEWWFDVEVILFERNVDVVAMSEKFEQSRLVQADSNYLDLLTPYIHPDLSYLRAGLNYCRTSNQRAVTTQREKDFAFPIPVVEENDSSSAQPDETTKQTSQNNQGLIIATESSEQENFEYEVATTDIFSQSEGQSSLVKATKIESVEQSNIEQQGSLEITAEADRIRPPIQVEFIEWQVPTEVPCVYAEQIDPSFASISYLLEAETQNQIQRVPQVINGMEWQQKRSAMLLPKSTTRMFDLYSKIERQRDITPLLHLNWRQQVHFGRENAQTIRLFAGQNFADQFDANGSPIVSDTDILFNRLNQPADEFYIPEEELALLSTEQQQALLSGDLGSQDSFNEDIFDKIELALADNTPINIEDTDNQSHQQTIDSKSTMLKQLWQLDGGVTVYLRNVGRIPYLHIDSDLDFRQPIFAANKSVELKEISDDLIEQGAIAVNQPLQPNYLQSVNFNQLRRVISKQVHYFDHPLFGMVVKINRYRWPEVEQKSDDDELVSADN
jgi:hypothetical protein